MKGPVVLLGPPGAGKTTAGRRVAERLGMPFVDLDDALGDAEAIFRDEGEASFRVRELRALERLLDGREVLIAAGAGVVDTAPARELLQERALCVVLDVDGATAVPRLLRGSPRPWLPAGDTAAAHTTWVARERGRADHRAALARVTLQGHGSIDDVVTALDLALGALKPIAPTTPAALFADGAHDAIALAKDGARCLVIVEQQVAALHGIHGDVVTPGGEAVKALPRVEELARLLIAQGATRATRLVAVGGGALLDAVGLCAALLFRGVPWAAVPTTLLAQADAGIGGKTAVDLDGRKNLLGAFHPPAITVVSSAFLRTLDDEALRAGRAEMLKHAMLAADAPTDGSARPDDFDVARSLALKTSVIRRDPGERGLRAVLNLGHTMAHALEAAAPISHGEAVRHGLRVMLRLSVAHAGLDPEVARALDARVTALGPLPPPHADLNRVREALAVDKKGGAWVLLRAPGLPVLRPIPEKSVEDALAALLPS